MHDALAQRSLDVEAKAHVLGAPLIRLFCARQEAVARPSRPRAFAIRGDLVARAKERGALWRGADLCDGAIEEGGFGGGGEDVGEEEGEDAALSSLCQHSRGKIVKELIGLRLLLYRRLPRPS